MYQDRNSKRFTAYIGFLVVMLGVWAGASLFARLIPGIPYIIEIRTVLLTIVIAMTWGYILFWCISHHINKGIRYAFAHAKMIRHIHNALLDAGYYYSKQYFNNEIVAVLPKIKVKFDKGLLQGKLYIQNNLRIHKKLEDRNISSALGAYVVKEQYATDDENWTVYEFINSKVDNQLVFNTYEELVAYTKNFGSYRLFMDKWNAVPLSSLLLVGSTGSGKTYSLYGLILQCLNWKIKPTLYFADPKASSLLVLGSKISPEHTAENTEDIIALLEEFYLQMEKRKKLIKKKLEQKLDSDYRSFNLSSAIFVIDEFSSFQSIVNTMDKQTRDRVAMLLRSIVLQGRQLGFFLWIVMQKSDANDIPTAIRANLIWKCVLGTATRTTYLTAFEETSDLPQKNFKVGQGLFSYQGLTRQPQIVSFPTLNFDINEAVKELELGSCNDPSSTPR